MARVRLLTIKHGETKDADGKGYGDDWPLAKLGEDDHAEHWLTTDHAHCSDVADDEVLSGPEALGKFIVAALNNRAPTWLYARAVALWGPDAQMLMVVEECAELQKAILDWRRERGSRGAIVEELADVRIMLEQVTGMFDAGAEVDAAYREKLNRLRARVNRAWQEKHPPQPPKPPSYTPPDATERNCGTCKHWQPVVDMNRDDPHDTTGVCNNPSRPWDTPEREASHGHWAAAVDAGEEWKCWEGSDA